ncbi:hypothetical protein Bca52824_030023 [Brassica carinata]|uniref:Uncharacterized protein n=1 Tax=Brassica carinata TaxID=52824 RepID=A0A8X7S7T9_BRACI|nr:hypothetical protein Bca52824_030023 [Brassica carinata]
MGLRRLGGGGGVPSSGGSVAGSGSSNMLRFNTSEIPGLKISPTVVLIMSINLFHRRCHNLFTSLANSTFTNPVPKHRYVSGSLLPYVDSVVALSFFALVFSCFFCVVLVKELTD